MIITSTYFSFATLCVGNRMADLNCSTISLHETRSKVAKQYDYKWSSYLIKSF